MNKYLYFAIFIGFLLVGCNEPPEPGPTHKKPASKAPRKARARKIETSAPPQPPAATMNPENPSPQVQIEVTQPQFKMEDEDRIQIGGGDRGPLLSMPPTLEIPSTQNLNIKIKPQTYRPQKDLWESFKNGQGLETHLTQELFYFFEQGHLESFVVLDCAPGSPWAIETLYQAVHYIMVGLPENQRLGLAVVNEDGGVPQVQVLSSPTNSEQEILLAFQKFKFNQSGLESVLFSELYESIYGKWSNQKPVFLITDKVLRQADLDQVQSQFPLMSVLQVD